MRNTGGVPTVRLLGQFKTTTEHLLDQFRALHLEMQPTFCRWGL